MQEARQAWVTLTPQSPCPPGVSNLQPPAACGPGWLWMQPSTKSQIYVKYYAIVLWLRVTMYLMCGPRQLFFFQCGPDTPKGRALLSLDCSEKPLICNQKTRVLPELFLLVEEACFGEPAPPISCAPQANHPTSVSLGVLVCKAGCPPRLWPRLRVAAEWTQAAGEEALVSVNGFLEEAVLLLFLPPLFLVAF